MRLVVFVVLHCRAGIRKVLGKETIIDAHSPARHSRYRFGWKMTKRQVNCCAPRYIPIGTQQQNPQTGRCTVVLPKYGPSLRFFAFSGFVASKRSHANAKKENTAYIRTKTDLVMHTLHHVCVTGTPKL